MNVDLQRLAQRQEDLVAAWQLVRLGWNRRKVEHRARQDGWRRIHQGVYVLSQSPLSRRQKWRAATLTSPNSFLSHASAGALYGFRPWSGAFETITRPGNGGPKRFGALLVLRSKTLDGDTELRDGIPITTAARTLVDLMPDLPDKQKRKATREALRLRVTTMANIRATIERHAHRSGAPFLTDLITRYATLPYERTRSDPEAYALEILHDAGIEPPQVNLRINGEEADLVWIHKRLIIEIDGPQFHRFKDENARKTRIWRKAGYTVRRISTNDVFDAPERLIALAAGP